jgi:hypothetical protein
MRRFLHALALSTLLTTPAFAIIGTTHCANATGTIQRREQEIWGANIIDWTHEGRSVDEGSVKIVSDSGQVIEDLVRTGAEIGDERTRTQVLKVVLMLDTGAPIEDYLICKTVEYPNVFD